MEPIHRFEERYMQHLYAIEHAIAKTYRAHPELTDWDAKDVIVGLIRTYQAEADNHAPPPLRFKPAGELAFDATRQACEALLGHNETSDSVAEPLSPDELLACLKRIRKSIERWLKERGRTIYLDLIEQHT